MVVLDSWIDKQPKAGRAVSGADRYDEVWDGIYVVPPLPDNEHQDLRAGLGAGPDFCAEVTTPGDRSRDKLDFYAGIGVRELLLVDRDPWFLELYRLNGGRLGLVGRSELAHPDALVSTVVPVSFRLAAGAERPAIEVVHRDGVQRWLV